YELDRRLGNGGQGVTANAFDPGLMPGSGLARDYPPIQRLAWRYLLPALRVLPGVHSTRTSGRNLAALANEARFDNVSGEYFDELAHPARIVVVSSGTHDPTTHTGMPDPNYTSAADLAHPAADESGDGRRRYTTSKLCNLLFTYELDRRLGNGGHGVTVNAFDPGLMPGSGLARDYPPLQRLAWRYLLPALRVLPNVRSTRTSGRCLAALANDARFDGVSGEYFEGRRSIRSSADSYDRAKALDLWETSERLLTQVG
ncbi:MAG TPA: hypothetical protein VMS92_02285, partial [Mycobacterium sp.]|nr:hypothetical protein [Mycobacterium sp.]